jgi:hypothetical protein
MTTRLDTGTPTLATGADRDPPGRVSILYTKGCVVQATEVG